MPQVAFNAALVCGAGVALLLAYTYVGYPLLTPVLARLRPRPIHRAPAEPSVSLIIAAYNEEQAIEDKLANSLALDYPRDKLEIVVASDGSTDRTDEIVRCWESRGVRLFVPDSHLGKTGTANAVVPTTSGEILVFSDATGVYNAGAIRALVANFSDPDVGAVTGWVRYEYGGSIAARGFAAYQRFVVPQRKAESRFGSETSVSGSIHAIRRDLFRPAPADLSYDMVHPLHVAQAGKRSVYEADAISVEQARLDPGDEFRSRIRIAVRAYTFIPYLLAGLRHCPVRMFTFQVVSHKLMRWASPVLLIVLLLSALVLATRGGVWLLPLALWVGGASLGALGWLASKLGISAGPLAAPLFFVTINLAYLLGLLRYLRGARLAGWKTER